MQINKLDNIMFLKNVESNYIDEAFIVLKKNVKLNNIKLETSNRNFKTSILKEAEFLINKGIEKDNIDFEKYKFSLLERKFKISRFLNFLLFLILIISIMKNFF